MSIIICNAPLSSSGSPGDLLRTGSTGLKRSAAYPKGFAKFIVKSHQKFSNDWAARLRATTLLCPRVCVLWSSFLGTNMIVMNVLSCFIIHWLTTKVHTMTRAMKKKYIPTPSESPMKACTQHCHN